MFQKPALGLKKPTFFRFLVWEFPNGPGLFKVTIFYGTFPKAYICGNHVKYTQRSKQIYTSSSRVFLCQFYANICQCYANMDLTPPPPPLNNVQKAAMSVHGGIPYIGATRAVQNRNCETAQDMGWRPLGFCRRRHNYLIPIPYRRGFDSFIYAM